MGREQMTEVAQFENKSKNEPGVIVIILVLEKLDLSRVILQSIPICLRHIPTKDLKTE